jgi:hypothetical protein
MRVSVGTRPGTNRLPARWHFPSARDPGTTHFTSRYADGSLECSCRGYLFAQRPDGLCLHTDAVQAADRPLTLLDALRRGLDDNVVRRPAGSPGVEGQMPRVQSASFSV